MSRAVAEKPFSPLKLKDRHAALQIIAVILGTVFLTVSSYISIPMYPVPITMQNLVVLLIGALYGWRLGTLTIIVWLLEGITGFPVFSQGSLGAFGTTAGYLVAFPLMAALTGWLAERGWNGQRFWLSFVSGLLANALCLGIGSSWLITLVGIEKAIMGGVLPFLPSSLLKAVLFAVSLVGINRIAMQWKSRSIQ